MKKVKAVTKYYSRPLLYLTEVIARKLWVMYNGKIGRRNGKAQERRCINVKIL